MMLITRFGPAITQCVLLSECNAWRCRASQTKLENPAGLLALSAGALSPTALTHNQLIKLLRQHVSRRGTVSSETNQHRTAVVFAATHVVLCDQSTADECLRLSNLIVKASVGRTHVDITYLKSNIRDLGAELIAGGSDYWRTSVWYILEQLGVDFRSILKVSSVDLEETISFLWQVGELSSSLSIVSDLLLSRSGPICSNFGYSRGTPVDRYYLDQYLRRNRKLIKGRVLDIGSDGVEKYRSINAVDAWVTVDNDESKRPSVVGDVHDRAMFGSGEFDCILLLNVLEHCHHPSLVIDNCKAWLKKDGFILVSIPNAQRIHEGPVDCWRILPDGCRVLFESWHDLSIETFGNCASVVSSIVGFAAEDVGASMLDLTDDRYPVITCVKARPGNGLAIT